MCKARYVELQKHVFWTYTCALPTEKTLRVSGGTNGGAITVERNDSRESNDESNYVWGDVQTKSISIMTCK